MGNFRHFSAGGGSPPEADKSLWLKRISNFRHFKLIIPPFPIFRTSTIFNVPSFQRPFFLTFLCFNVFPPHSYLITLLRPPWLFFCQLSTVNCQPSSPHSPVKSRSAGLQSCLPLYPPALDLRKEQRVDLILILLYPNFSEKIRNKIGFIPTNVIRAYI